MNKRILGVGTASAVLAAMPLLGVFATEAGSVTDTVTITVDSSCSLGESVSGATPSAGITNGNNNKTLQGSKFSISCNDNGGWTLNAKGASDGGAPTAMHGTNGGTTIATGTDLDNPAVSNWAVQATGDTVTSAYKGKFGVIPGEDTPIAESTNATSGSTVDITYGVSISNDQPAGTYTGKVTYTLVYPKVDGD